MKSPEFLTTEYTEYTEPESDFGLIQLLDVGCTR